MTLYDDHRAAENTMRELLSSEGMPQPDEVEYRERSLELFWHESKAVVVIDLDEPPGEPQRR